MRIHLIAIGGSAMHNLALALYENGYQVSGSDDEIFEPSKSRLAAAGLLPDKIGWDETRITKELDFVILGMHARENNPELLKAKAMGLKVVSYPEFLYEESKSKKRVVIGGSHGKTSITAMILHVLHKNGVDTDYLVGAQLEGFSTMVRLSDAPLIIIEGDEYLSSPIDRKPKFLWYKPDLAIISGIAWDHINVFPDYEDYKQQFRLFIESLQERGKLFYFGGDPVLEEVVASSQNPKATELKAYEAFPHEIKDGKTFLRSKGELFEIPIFGKHNLQNLSAAFHICKELGIDEALFIQAITSFKGAARRMELIAENYQSKVFKDFAHAPSKLKASCEAAREQFPDHRIIACVELHTFSSLNKDFLGEYSGGMDAADLALVYYNPHTIEHKGLKEISISDVKEAFLPSQVEVFNQSDQLILRLKETDKQKSIILLMTSGNFDGISLDEFGLQLIS